MSNNLVKPKQLIILGGGSSLSEGISKGLWDKLKNHFVIGTNHSYNYFNSTILCYADKDFYTIGSETFSPEQREKHSEILKNLPLIVGKLHRDIKTFPNTITLQTNDSKYYRNVKLGIYKSNLVGLFALSLAIYLLDEGEIFLLGYDNGTINNRTDDKGRRITHFYQGKINHRGIGKCNYFEGKKRADKDFGVYANEKKVKIYNISIMSNINTFIKGGYGFFFENLNKEKFNQEELRQYIKEKLK